MKEKFEKIFSRVTGVPTKEEMRKIKEEEERKKKEKEKEETEE